LPTVAVGPRAGERTGTGGSTRAGRSTRAGDSAQAEGGRQARRWRWRRALAIGSMGLAAVLALEAAWGWGGTPSWVVAAAAAVAALVFLPRPDPERWMRGAAGERATAEVLAELSPRRWIVLHDRRLPGTRANVDHLAVGPSGVWVIDSKAYRSALRVRWGRVVAGDRVIDTAAVRFEAEIVSDRLGVAVRPLVVVHGHGLRRRGSRNGSVPVVPATSALRVLRRRWWQPRLGRREVTELAEAANLRFPPAWR
jgi:hypothetical protein